MITEIAQFTIKDGMQAEFEANAAKARELFRRAKGFHGLELKRTIEKPNLYFLDHQMGDAGKSHCRLPQFRGFQILARPRRALLCFAARCRAF